LCRFRRGGGTDFIFGRAHRRDAEPRAVVAEWNAAEARLTILSGHPGAPQVQNLAALHLGLEEAQVRIVSGRRRLVRIKVHIYADEMATYALRTAGGRSNSSPTGSKA